ncbi:MAG: HD domain-containing protein [Desulfococcaceae bacterium]|jgi:HD superfamily phosphohydrolase|nr:HD domain-containing protein [Desulfococcaceae bacterium]
MGKTYEIRDPVHGFIKINEWERDIIDHPVFQRLRRIRQLSLSNMVYPGAMHTRFEHSLGVMHVATKMFDEIVKKRFEFLKSELNYNKTGLDTDRTIVRLASLLHDVGHAPFSHAGEDLMTTIPNSNKKYKHENYSAAAVTLLMEDVIDNHPLNQNYNITAKKIAQFLNGSPQLGRCLLWRDLVSSQLDADRADYLLRDSYHIGAAYGNYDLNRLFSTITVIMDPETEIPKLAIEEGGIHTAEALIIARYMMFTQVYFHHTRRSYDYHIVKTLKGMLETTQKDSQIEIKNAFPPPISEYLLKKYLEWNDWKVLGMINAGECNEDGITLSNRQHHRCIYETPINPNVQELEFLEILEDKYDDLIAFIDNPSNSLYKIESGDIFVSLNTGKINEQVKPLSHLSNIVRELKSINQHRIYSPYECKKEAKEIVEYFMYKEKKNES